jgi:hypothetical protein
MSLSKAIEGFILDGLEGSHSLYEMRLYKMYLVMYLNYLCDCEIDKIALSNTMADFIDAGGKLLVGRFIWSYDDWGFGGGRLLDENYSPFEIATTDFFEPASLGSFDLNSPIMAGITSVTDNFNHQDPALSINGTWVASWSDGLNFVATAPGVVGLNQEYFNHADFGGQTGELLHNALLYLGAERPWSDVPWVSEVPTSGVTLPDSTFTVDVIFDSTGLTGGECYTASLGLVHDDPGLVNPFIIPLHMCVAQPVYGVDLEPEASTGSGMPGDVITYTLRLTNTGNVADSFELAFSNVDPGWIVDLPVAGVDLMVGQGVDIFAIVTIPAEAGNGEYDSFILTATSMHDPIDDVEITTSVEIPMFDIYMPVIVR